MCECIPADVQPECGVKGTLCRIHNIWAPSLIAYILPNKPSVWHSTFQLASKQLDLPVQGSCCVIPQFLYEKLFEEGWCLGHWLWAARWSCVRTLNYSAIPQQIEAVMRKTSWLASSCAGEHQRMSANSFCSDPTGYATPHSNFTNVQFRPGLQFTAGWNVIFLFFLHQTQYVLCFHREGWES